MPVLQKRVYSELTGTGRLQRRCLSAKKAKRKTKEISKEKKEQFDIEVIII